MKMNRRDLLVAGGLSLLAGTRASGRAPRLLARSPSLRTVRKRAFSKLFKEQASSHHERRSSLGSRLGLARPGSAGCPLHTDR